MDHDVEYWDESETDVPKVCWEGLEVLLLCQSVRAEFLRELSVDLQVLLVPVIQQVMIRRHHAAELVDSVRSMLRQNTLEDRTLTCSGTHWV